MMNVSYPSVWIKRILVFWMLTKAAEGAQRRKGYPIGWLNGFSPREQKLLKGHLPRVVRARVARGLGRGGGPRSLHYRPRRSVRLKHHPPPPVFNRGGRGLFSGGMTEELDAPAGIVVD